MAPRIGRDGCPGQVVVKEAMFPCGDVCCTRQQTGDFCADPFLSIPAVRQLSAGKGVGRSASSPWLATGEEGGKIRQQRLRARSTRGGKEQHRLRARSARGEKKKELHRNCAKKRTEEETCARDTAQAAEAPWRRRARKTARRRRKCAVSALGVEEKVIARESAQGQVQRRERSGHARVCTGHAGRLTRKDRSGVARRSSNAQRIGGLSHCVGCGVTQKKEECKPPWERERGRDCRISGRDCGETPSTFNRHATFRV